MLPLILSKLRTQILGATTYEFLQLHGRGSPLNAKHRPGSGGFAPEGVAQVAPKTTPEGQESCASLSTVRSLPYH